MSVKVQTRESRRFGKTIIVPIDGEVKVSSTGIVEVSVAAAKALSKGLDWTIVKSSKVLEEEEEEDEIVEEEESEEEVDQELQELISKINGFKVLKELKAYAKDELKLSKESMGEFKTIGELKSNLHDLITETSRQLKENEELLKDEEIEE